RVQYEHLPLGEYIFQVQAVDRDLNYSEPATVALEITPDPQAEALREMVERTEMGGEFIGESAALRQVKTFVAQMGPTELTVLILGETGTGKGITARLLHELSPRRDGTVVHVNCGAITKGLEESELFGHEKGAFTSADSRKIGRVERAAGGTLFLDEIGDLPLDTQAKLLQLLGEGTFERVGGTQTLKSDARVIAATNRDLERMVREGTFRGDLYYRLQMAMVQLPPLRERREDILPLARHFVAKAAATVGKKPPGLTLELEALLLAYSWPGNVRQLKHLLDTAVVVCPEPYLWKQHLPINLETQLLGQEEWVSLDENERRYILQVLDQTQGIIKGPKGAAAILGKHEATLRNRMRKLGIERKAG
ncbi:MAG: sigma-54-dependent Fis family transcriptional regulator, partial [Candidatus Latescibacteria bacterium]|nr:sigma-54-dependent Fis family transcriptional regulator [Candidatus Latescibacterota bacterium]